MSEPIKGSGQAAETEWIKTAMRVVSTVYPTVFFGNEDRHSAELERAFDYCVDQYFCVPDSYMDWEGVMEAWRKFYKSCIPF